MTQTPGFDDMSDEELAALVNPEDPGSELEALREIGEEELAEEERRAGE